MKEKIIDINRQATEARPGHPYNENYLVYACPTMGSLFETGLLTMLPEEFSRLFLNSRIPIEWEHGNPAYLAGKSGLELYEEMTGQNIKGKPCREYPEEEYWCGYVCCYAQWYFGCTFHDLLSAVPLSELLMLYHPLHEADISKTLQIIQDRLASG